MSIILEALKKAEAAPETTPTLVTPPPRSTPLWIYRAALVGCVAVVLLGIAHFTRKPTPVVHAPAQTAKAVISPITVHSSASAPAPKAPVPAQTPMDRLLHLAQADLTLNGVVQSGDGRSLALINNQVLQEGDQIGEMRIARVTARSVELQDDSGKTKTLQLAD